MKSLLILILSFFTVYSQSDPNTEYKSKLNIALHKSIGISLEEEMKAIEEVHNNPYAIVDGSLDYLPASTFKKDGVAGFYNKDYNELMEVIIRIDLKGTYKISRIAYNPGNVPLGTWTADYLKTPLGTLQINPGKNGIGQWTEISGSKTDHIVEITLGKTRTSEVTDWMFIGEIAVYGVEEKDSSKQISDSSFNEFLALFKDVPDEGLYVNQNIHWEKDLNSDSSNYNCPDKEIDKIKFKALLPDIDLKGKSKFFALYKFDLDKNNTGFLIRYRRTEEHSHVVLFVVKKSLYYRYDSGLTIGSFGNEAKGFKRALVIGKEGDNYKIIELYSDLKGPNITHKNNFLIWDGAKFIKTKM